ncbi:MAG: DNA polymerase III subunit delta [Eubacteriales bacterium]
MASQRSSSQLSALKKDIRENTAKSVYIFYGEEKYLIEHYVNTLKDKLVNPDLAEFNYTEFDDRNLRPEQIMDAVESLPMLSDKRLIVVFDFDLFNQNQEDTEYLCKMISEIPESSCLVFVYNVLEYKAKSSTKLYKTIKERGRIVELPVQNESELISWLKRHFRAQNKTIDNTTASYMLHICGKLMYKLKHEVDKVAAYANTEKIAREDIDAVCVPVIDAVIYKMTDAVVEQRYSDALQIMRDLVQMGYKAIVILAAIGKQLRRLFYTKRVMEFGDPSEFLKKEMDVNSHFLINKTIRNARNLSEHWCASSLELCAEYDYKLKSTGWEEDMLLELFILNLSHIRDMEAKRV